MSLVASYLERNSYFVYEYDYFQQTGLHWAAKRGFLEMCQLLMSYRANIKALDSVRLLSWTRSLSIQIALSRKTKRPFTTQSKTTMCWWCTPSF